ncbi:MAG: aminopeptidase [Bacteroidetes bacterium]|nr:aminopeptidase [Bacteroidota bacterium]
MKRVLTCLLFTAILCSVITKFYAQDKDTLEKEGYRFTVIKEVKTTPVKDQYRSGTCWSFASLALLESELLRMGKGEFDLSEMFVVRKSYEDKAVKYVRMHGSLNFGGGGALNDALNVLDKYGMVTEEAYSGMVIGEEKHIHGEMDGAVKAYLDDIIENRNKKLTPVWYTGFEGLMDAYLGKLPEKFEYNEKQYSPRTFADQVLELKTEDYILVSSYTHHPFYKKFILEVPDNWSWGEVYNVAMEDLITIIDHAINNGYTVAWAGDVSEKGFSWKDGVAVIPEKDIENMSDLERAKWDDLSQKEKDELLYTFEKPGKEKTITQALRQQEFDNYDTGDDHGLQITGIATDQNGNKYYLMKNSWNTTDSKYNGYLYMSETYLRFKTMSMMVNKNCLSKEMRNNLCI